MDRKALKFAPKWEGAHEQQAWALAWKNVWRVRPDWDVDDLMQEARIIFLRMVDRYWPEVQSPAHFATLFRRSVQNKFNNLAKQRSRRRARISTTMDEAGLEAAAGGQPGTQGEVEVADLLEQAERDPALGRIVQQLVLSKYAPRPQRSGVQRPGKRRTRETTNNFLCRVSGEDTAVDMVATVRAWINGELSLT